MNYIDIGVGGRLRRRRLAIGRSLSEQAAAVGLAEARLLSIEEGADRASAFDLFRFCETLGMTPADIYDDVVLLPREAGDPAADANATR